MGHHMLVGQWNCCFRRPFGTRMHAHAHTHTHTHTHACRHTTANHCIPAQARTSAYTDAMNFALSTLVFVLRWDMHAACPCSCAPCRWCAAAACRSMYCEGGSHRSLISMRERALVHSSKRVCTLRGEGTRHKLVPQVHRCTTGTQSDDDWNRNNQNLEGKKHRDSP